MSRAATGLGWALRLVLGGTLLYSGAMKLGDPAGFALEISNYRFLPSLAPYLAVTLPGVELALGAGLLVGTRRWRQAAALAAFGLMAVFTVAVVQVVVRGINVSCGCFGGDSGPVTLVTVARDLLLVAVAAALYVVHRPAPAAASSG